jgi:hypothetical protein
MSLTIHKFTNSLIIIDKKLSMGRVNAYRSDYYAGETDYPLPGR